MAKSCFALQTLLTLLMAASLTGCGQGAGGDSGGATAAPTTSASSAPSVVVPPVNEEVTATTQLVADRDFEFNASEELSLSITELKTAVKPSAYRLCRLNEDGEVDAQDCLLSTRFTGPVDSHRFELGNEVQSLVLTVYVFEQPLRVETFQWRRAMGMNWQVRY